jgi:hypothetical protein
MRSSVQLVTNPSYSLQTRSASPPFSTVFLGLINTRRIEQLIRALRDKEASLEQMWHIQEEWAFRSRNNFLLYISSSNVALKLKLEEKVSSIANLESVQKRFAQTISQYFNLLIRETQYLGDAPSARTESQHSPRESKIARGHYSRSQIVVSHT